MDLQYVLRTIGVYINPATLPSLTADGHKSLRDQVVRSMNHWITSETQRCSKKLYLLQDRREPQERGPAVYKPLAFRHYLLVYNAQHRKALTRLLLSSHPLASERLRWPDRYRLYVPAEKRLCRFCSLKCETPEHALLECLAHTSLALLRADFLAKIYSAVPSLPPINVLTQDPAHFICVLLDQRKVTYLLARFVFDIFEVYESVPLRVPHEYVIRYASNNTRMALDGA
jgi:hypothetical protein